MSDKEERKPLDQSSTSAPQPGMRSKRMVGEVENTVSPSPVPKRSVKKKAAAPELAAASYGGADSPKSPDEVEGISATMRIAAQKAHAWLSGRSKGKDSVAKSSGTTEDRAASTNKHVPQATEDDRSKAVPAAVTTRFLKVEHDYYFFDKTLAFSDRGTKLATRCAHPEVVQSMVEIAAARGWDSVTVKGTEAFRRGVWLEARQSGLKVVGYKPTALDLAELGGRPVNNSLEKSLARAKEPYENRQAKKVERDKPQKSARGLDPSGNARPISPSGTDPELAKKAKAFAENKPSFVVKKYPDLAGAYGLVEAAAAFSVEKLPEEAREEFVGMARRHVIQKIVAGDPVKGPKVCLAASEALENDRGAKPSVRQPSDVGAASDLKVMTKER